MGKESGRFLDRAGELALNVGQLVGGGVTAGSMVEHVFGERFLKWQIEDGFTLGVALFAFLVSSKIKMERGSSFPEDSRTGF